MPSLFGSTLEHLTAKHAGVPSLRGEVFKKASPEAEKVRPLGHGPEDCHLDERVGKRVWEVQPALMPRCQNFALDATESQDA